MSQFTPAAELIAGLRVQGWNNAQIGRALGIDSSLVRQAYNPSPGQKQKPLTKYVPALQQLQGQKPGAKPAALPARRTTKSGTTAKVRQGIKNVTTKRGRQEFTARAKKGPKTLRKAIEKAAKQGKKVGADVNFKKGKAKSPDDKAVRARDISNAWLSTGTHDAKSLLNRIDNPGQGDNWKAGDVNAALAQIARENNSSKISSATGPQEFSIYTMDF